MKKIIETHSLLLGNSKTVTIWYIGKLPILKFTKFNLDINPNMTSQSYQEYLRKIL